MMVPRWRVYMNGELYGAYLHEDHAQEVARRLQRKGRKVKVSKKMAVW